MGRKTAGTKGGDGVLQKLAAIAKRLPDVEEGVACAGTVVESRTMKVNGKAFLFLRRGQAMLKLGDSLPEAREIATDGTDRVVPGSGGWTKVVFEDGPPPMPLMRRWIRESYWLFADARPSGGTRTIKKTGNSRATGRKTMQSRRTK